VSRVHEGELLVQGCIKVGNKDCNRRRLSDYVGLYVLPVYIGLCVLRSSQDKVIVFRPLPQMAALCWKLRHLTAKGINQFTILREEGVKEIKV
jgi:hypothetical protein